MELIETTVGEHFINRGKIEGKIEGKIKGEIIGQIRMLEILFSQGVISRERFEETASPLRRQLKELRDKAEA